MIYTRCAPTMKLFWYRIALAVWIGLVMALAVAVLGGCQSLADRAVYVQLGSQVATSEVLARAVSADRRPVVAQEIVTVATAVQGVAATQPDLSAIDRVVQAKIAELHTPDAATLSAIATAVNLIAQQALTGYLATAPPTDSIKIAAAQTLLRAASIGAIAGATPYLSTTQPATRP